MDDSSIEPPLLNGEIAKAQKKIDNRNFEIRKQILEYDDVSNDQRLTVYELRSFFLEDNDNEKLIFEYLDNLLEKIADKALPEDQNEYWNFDDFTKSLSQSLGNAPEPEEFNKNQTFAEIMDVLNDFYKAEYLNKFEPLKEKKKELERQVSIQVLDACWKRPVSYTHLTLPTRTHV